MSNKKWQRNAVVLLFLISQLTLVSSNIPYKIDALLPEVRSTYPDTGIVYLKWNKPEVYPGGGPIQSYTI